MTSSCGPGAALAVTVPLAVLLRPPTRSRAPTPLPVAASLDSLTSNTFKLLVCVFKEVDGSSKLPVGKKALAVASSPGLY